MNTERLEQEVRSQHAKVQSLLRSRRDHPSYGVTKGMLRDEAHILQGMITAWLYVSGTWTHHGIVLWTPDVEHDVYNLLDISMAGVWSAIHTA